MCGSSKEISAFAWIILVSVPVLITLIKFGAEEAVEMLFLIWITSPLWVSLYNTVK
jgi:hypothetical protein